MHGMVGLGNQWFETGVGLGQLCFDKVGLGVLRYGRISLGNHMVYAPV